MWTNSEKEATGINSSAKTATDIFKSVGLKKSLATSTFDLKDMTQGNTTLYICIPAERLETHGTYLRLIVGSLIRTVQKHRNKRVLMIMDEFYSLGYMKTIANSMGQMPGYNLQLWPIIQDLNQLRDTYGETAWETFIANAAVRMFMGIDDQFTAEYVSKQLGTKTDAIYNEESESMQSHTARPLLNPAEVRQSPDIITFTKKTNPIKIKKIKYWENPDLSQRASRNPYVE